MLILFWMGLKNEVNHVFRCLFTLRVTFELNNYGDFLKF
jgi:hypothetical protein